jgi:hypothetical protein
MLVTYIIVHKFLDIFGREREYIAEDEAHQQMLMIFVCALSFSIDKIDRLENLPYFFLCFKKRENQEKKLFFSLCEFITGDAEIMSLFVHVRRDDGQGDDPAGGRVPGTVHSRPVRDLALQKESYALYFYLFFVFFFSSYNKFYRFFFSCG